MRGIDISNHQGAAGLNLAALLPQIDFCIVKATQGDYYVDPYCDGFVQTLISANKPFGFYHFADWRNSPETDARYFIDNTIGYFGKGIPVLDWESLDGSMPSVDWANTFVSIVASETGVIPWIYSNPWCFNQGGVNPDCMRWIASYPNIYSPSLNYDLPDPPETDGLVGAWQFCSDGHLSGYDGNLDFNVFYGDVNAWNLYASPKNGTVTPTPDPAPEATTEPESFTFENEKVKIDVELK